MKKLFGLLFVLALAFVFVACGKEYKIEVPEDQANVVVEKGESMTITPTFTEGETLTWTSSDPNVVTVEGGKITAVEEGNATITIAISGKKEDKATAEVKVTVKPISVKEMSLTGKTACFVGDEFDLTLSVLPENAKDKSVTWASSDATIATVTDGKVKALAPGEVTISATANDGSGKKAELKINVAKINVNNVSVSGLQAMEAGETQTLAVVVDPANATNGAVEFASSDQAVLTVTAAGVVTAAGPGTAKITVTSKDDATKKAELEITVHLAVAAVEAAALPNLMVGNEVTLAVTVTPENASDKSVTFASSDATIASVSDEGVVTALKAGNATITITANDDETKTTTVAVSVHTLQLSGEKALIGTEEKALTVTLTPADENQAYTFTSSDPEVLTVDAEGKVKGVKKGTAKVTVAASDNAELKAEFTVYVFEKLVDVAYVSLGATADVTLGNKTLVFDTDVFATVDKAIAAVNDGGKVILLPGEYTEEINLNKSLTLSSLLADKNPVEDDTDFRDATKAAVVKSLVLTSKADTTIEGLTFTGAARVGRFEGQVANFTFQNNLVYDTAEATVAWAGGRYGNGVTTKDALLKLPGFITLSPSWSWVYNTQILNNKFDNVSDTPVFITCVDGTTIKGNIFKDIDRDAIRFDYASDAGHHVIEDNIFENVANMGIYVQSLGGQPLNVEIYSNYFKNVGTANTTTNWNISAAIANAVHQEGTAGDCEFTIKYNIFEGCNMNISLRTNVASTYDKKLAATVEYNAFILADASAKINRNLFNKDTLETNKPIGDYNKNFYGTDLLTPIAVTAEANFENAASVGTTVYANVYALEKAMPADAHLPAYTATPAEKTVAEAYELDLNTPVTLKGQVSLVYSAGFWLRDDTGAIYVYGHADEVKLGDKVEVRGNLYKYTSNGTDTKRLNFAKEVIITEAGTYTANPAAKTEAEFKEILQAGLEITLEDVLVTKVSGVYVTLKVGETEFTLNANSLTDAKAFAEFISNDKTVTITVLTYFKDGNKASMSVMGYPAWVTPAEEIEPTCYIVNPKGIAGHNIVNKFEDLTLEDDMVIYFANAEYDDPITINKNNVKLISLDGNTVFNAQLTIADGVDGLTIDGLTFAKGGVIIAPAPAEGAATGVKNITLNNVTALSATKTDEDAWCHFNVPVDGFTLTNSNIEIKANRGIRFEAAAKNWLVDNNKFIGKGVWDSLRAMDLVDGSVVITNNLFENTQQSFIMIRYIGAGEYLIEGNTFKNADCVSIDMREAKTDFEGKAVIKVLRNAIDGGENDWGAIRLRNSLVDAALTDPTKVEVTINYNKFVNIVFDADTTYYVDKPTGVCTTASWNIDYNYSDLGQPVLGADGWFCGMEKSAANWYENLADYEYEVFPPIYDFDTYFKSYASDWTTSYGKKTLTGADLGMKACLDLTFELSNAAKQTGTITTMPTLAVKANKGADVSQYVTVTGNLAEMKYVKVALAQWTTKTFKDIHLEYTKDGETWTACSASITTPGILINNVELDGATGVRLVYTTNTSGTSNVQLGLKSISFAKTLAELTANLTLDFMDGTVGQAYNSTAWTREKYTTEWVEMSGQMNCREKDGVRVVNFVAGYSMTYKYTYNKGGESLGVANKLTLKVGNYFSPQQAIPCKVILIDSNGKSIYLVGSSSEFYSFPATDALVAQEFTFDAADIVSIQVVTKSTYNGSQYLYVGDVHLTYEQPQE